MLKDLKIKLAFVGDLSFGDFPFAQGYGLRSTINGDPIKAMNLFSNVKSEFTNADIVFGNLETVLSNKNENPNSLLSVEMRGDPLVARVIKNAGFNCVNIANNHMLQHGPAAFWDTVDTLEKIGISVIGLKGGQSWHCKPVIFNKKGQKIGFLGYAFEIDKYCDSETCYAFGEPTSLIFKDINRLRTQVDLLIVSCHWGDEFVQIPSAEIIQLARDMVIAGVDIVVGHHPHVLQGVENYRNKIIAYSLGNFIFDMCWDATLTETMILKCVFTIPNKIEYDVLPMKIDSNYTPSFLEGKEKTDLEEKIATLSKIIQESNCDDDYILKFMKLKSNSIKRNRTKAYLYFIKNLNRYNKTFIIQQIKRTFLSRVEDALPTNKF
jgi:poly-gamma-glutamate synthesis protein (capsule biosynthesis protein)